MSAAVDFPAWLEDHLTSSKKIEPLGDNKKKKTKKKKRKEENNSSSSSSISIWNWAPIRAIARICQQRFHCVFSIFVQAVDGLPPSLNGLRLVVQCHRKDTKLQTMPCRVFQGVAEFEETLHIKATVYGHRATSTSNAIKYMPKEFNLSVIALDISELFLCNHRIDLSRLLPASADDFLEFDRPMSSTASFKLTGKAEGGVLVATFDVEVLNKELRSLEGNASARFGESPLRRALRAFNSLPNSAHSTPITNHSNHHFTSPCTSDLDLNDFISMERLNLDGGVDESSEFSSPKPQDRSSSEEEIFFALKNDPLKLDSFLESESLMFLQGEATLAPPTPRQSQEGSELMLDTSTEHRTDADDSSSEEEVESSALGHETKMQKSPQTAYDHGDAEVRAKEEASTPNRNSECKVPSSHEASRELEDEGNLISTEGNEKLEVKDSPQEEEDSLASFSFCKSSDWELHLEEKEKDENLVSIIGPEVKESLQEEVTSFACFSFCKGSDWTLHLEDGDEEHAAAMQEFNSDIEGAVVEYVNEAQGFYLEDAGELEDALQFLSSCTDGEIGKEFLEVNEVSEHDSFVFEADAVFENFFDLLEGGREIVGMSSESESNSPKALLLKEFEREFSLQGGIQAGLSMPGTQDNQLREELGTRESAAYLRSTGSMPSTTSEDYGTIVDIVDDMELASFMEAAELEMHKAAQTLRSKARAKMMEDAETEALMKEWGLSDKAFESSPPKSTYGSMFPSFPAPLHLAVGMGSVIQLRDGGTLRAMSPAHFQASRTRGGLVMQVSKPVVVPAEMGSSAVDILSQMAAKGLENMASQAFIAMPLEDLSGKTVEQIAMGESTALDGPDHMDNRALQIRPWQPPTPMMRNDYESKALVDRENGSSASAKVGKVSFKGIGDSTEEFVSLEDLTPLALQKIEALAIEGLKIQSDMSEEAPCSVEALSWDENEKNKKCCGGGMLGGGVTLHMLDRKGGKEDSHGNVDCLLGMAISLEEWMRLDARVYDEAENHQNSQEVMAVHSAVHEDMVAFGSDVDKKGRGSQKTASNSNNVKWGCMGNTLTVAMLVQLRDPLRNYDPVGAPMMALVQAERVIELPLPKLVRRVSIKGNCKVVEGEDDQHLKQVKEEVNPVKEKPQFKITGIHVSGLKPPEEIKNKGWGSQKQQQSASRWLIANGMAKHTRHAFHKPKLPAAKTKVKEGETLWSISARVHGSGTEWREVAELNPHIRNPDIIFANDTIRTR